MTQVTRKMILDKLAQTKGKLMELETLITPPNSDVNTMSGEQKATLDAYHAYATDLENLLLHRIKGVGGP